MHNYNDVYPPMLVPTWDNGRKGDAYIAKRLDRFIIHESLMERMGNIQSNFINSFFIGS